MEMLKDLSLLMIDPAAIEWMPESIARECCVLPVSRTADSIHVVFPVGSNSQHEELLSKLQFLLACKISYDIADNELIAPAIIRHYGAHYSEIENCNPEFQFRCPKRWALLSSTIHSDVRFCSECSQNVFFCHSDEELQNRVLQGQCVAFYKYEEIVMGLIDFCSLNVTDTDPPSHEAFQ